MNEPMTNAKYGRLLFEYQPDWEVMNRIYKECTEAIREIDPNHIVFLEGNFFSMLFDGLEEPFTDNLVYSSHNYSGALSDSKYGTEEAEWDKQKVKDEFLSK